LLPQLGVTRVMLEGLAQTRSAASRSPASTSPRAFARQASARPGSTSKGGAIEIGRRGRVGPLRSLGLVEALERQRDIPAVDVVTTL
jgi:hypothetical protein